MLQLNLKMAAIATVLLICCLSSVSSYRILAVFHTPSKSHFIVGSALMKELARRGHVVTVISPFPLKTPLKNYNDIPVTKSLEIMESGGIPDLLKMRNVGIIKNLVRMYEFIIPFTTAVLEEPGVQALLHSNQTFDVVISEVFISEALYGLAEHFHAPLIGLSAFGAVQMNTDMVGSPSPPSYVPNTMLKFTDRMSLAERVCNLAILTWTRIYKDFFALPLQEALYRKHFPNAKRSMLEVSKNAALVLLNQHVSLSYPRPYMPNQIEVGGMHINRKRSPLPADIQKFLDGAIDGAIYFSMGSNLKSTNLPIEKRQAILDTFRGLKQRVLWKFEESDLPGKPDNVFISDWFPQDDILAHPNVRAFITHGGLLSTTESIYHGKPFVGIPIFGDQFLNMARAEATGYGIMLDYIKLSKDTFAAAIKRILHEPKYTELVRAVSARYRDQPIEPLALAVYWVEHVARHKGATYLRCAGLDLNFWQYHSLDAIVLLFGGILFVVVLLLLLVRCACCKVVGAVCQTVSVQKQQKYKQKKQ